MLRLDEFTYDEYRALLDRVRRGRANLCFADFRKPITEPRFFILRHDVDFTPAGALEMAEIEAEMGIRATYYFLLTSDFYNLLSERFASVPRRIADLGHEIGLHYDLQILETVGDQSPRESLLHQADILARLSGQPIRSIAMHNPSLSGLDPFRSDGGETPLPGGRLLADSVFRLPGETKGVHGGPGTLLVALRGK